MEKNVLGNSASLFSLQKSVYKHVKCKHNIFRRNKDKSIMYLGDSRDIWSNYYLTSTLMFSAEDEGMGYFI